MRNHNLSPSVHGVRAGLTDGAGDEAPTLQPSWKGEPRRQTLKSFESLVVLTRPRRCDKGSLQSFLASAA